MSMVEFDDISNKAISSHLGEQDKAIKEIRELLQDSIADRRGIHERIDALIAERKQLIRDGEVYQESIEQRLASVEGRDDILAIRDAVERLLAVNALSLGLHDWLTKHRVRVRLLAACAVGGVPVFSAALNIVIHRLGWV